MTPDEQKQIKEYRKLNKVEIILPPLPDEDTQIVKIFKTSKFIGAPEESPWQHNAIKAMEDG